LANKKKKRAEKPREMTRRHLAQWQREKRKQRIILGGGIFIVAAIILIVLAGWYASEYRPLHQTAIKVNETKFNMGYYVDMLSFSVAGQPPEYTQYYADGVIKQIEQDELIRQGALALGISVSDGEVRDKLKGSDMKLDDAVLDLVRTQLLQDKLKTEYFDSKVPQTAEQVHIMAMLLESEQQAYEMRNRLLSSENFTALAEEYSLDSYSKTHEGDIGWHPESILAELLGSSVPGEYAFGSEVGTLSQPRYDGEKSKGVGYWLIKVVEMEDETDAQVQAILLGSEEEAQDVRARLEAGEDFATLAKELSQEPKSKENGGDLGLVSQGSMSAAFEGYVFNPEVKTGVLSAPIRDDTVSTKGGYWLIDVLDRDSDRQLETDDRDYLMTKALNEWVSSLWADPGNKVDDSYLNAGKKLWVIQRVLREQK
jgi:parvulin-like peptidyl-prolyl isomerase